MCSDLAKVDIGRQTPRETTGYRAKQGPIYETRTNL